MTVSILFLLKRFRKGSVNKTGCGVRIGTGPGYEEGGTSRRNGGVTAGEIA